METAALRINATHIAYLIVCRRKLWLFAGGMEMEHFSEQVLEGRHIHESSYSRRRQDYVELQFDGVKIDFFDARARVVHETKRGRSIESAHIAQVQFYLYKLWQQGITDASGIIEYPDLRKTQEVPPLDAAARAQVVEWEAEAQRIAQLAECPPVVEKPYCRSCAYCDLCYISEP